LAARNLALGQALLPENPAGTALGDAQLLADMVDAAQHGYPPDLQDDAVQIVLQQAEVLSMRWAAARRAVLSM
jgi:hypothetical protein